MILIPRILLLVFLMTGSHTAIIPPPWSDPNQNPCANMTGGWQLLYWLPLKRCFKIFTVGFPCPSTMELSPILVTAMKKRLYPTNNTLPIAECRCPPGTSLHSLTNECYSNFGIGPCDKGEYFSPISENPAIRSNRLGICRSIKKCGDTNLIFWPTDGKCYTKFTKGPCTKGQLLVENQHSFGECKCESDGLLQRYFYSADGTCYEHFTRGPCRLGKLFLPNGRCDCHTHLPHYHKEDDMCFELDSQGPCPVGHVFHLLDNDTSKTRAKCLCKEGYVLWKDGNCYRLYTRGPCDINEFLINATYCMPNLCSKGQLYFPAEESCYRIGSQGPCDLNQVVVFDFTARPSIDGISYNGICGCSGIIRNLDEKCTDMDANNSNACQSSPGMVDINGICYKLYTRGPCGPGQWLEPQKYTLKNNENYAAVCTCRPGYIMENNSSIIRCNAPSVELAKYLNFHRSLFNSTSIVEA